MTKWVVCTVDHRPARFTLRKEDLIKQPYIKEKFLQGDAEYWFGTDSPYADYISLEGIVIDGVYHPVAITQNHPLVPEFTETVSMTPNDAPILRA